MAIPLGWNRQPPWADYKSVECETTREALSAQLDGEDDPGERAGVDAHLTGCAACRQWLDRAALVNRLARTSPAPAIAPLSDDALATLLAAAPGRGRAWLALTLRALLGVLGAMQLGLALLQVAAVGQGGTHVHGDTTLDGATPNHLWNESAAWNLAIGAGFLWIAARRTRPGGIVPTLTAFIGVLSLLSVVDIMHGRVEPLRLISHGLILAGYLIILALTRPGLNTGDPRPTRQPGTSRYRARFDDEESAYPMPTVPREDSGAPAARSTRHIAA
jgi:predicted anti-sigma-YlaC factor YlaD